MARFFASVICLLAVFTGLRADEPLEKRCQAVFDEYEAIHNVLRSIHDSKSASKAMAELEFVRELPDLKGRVGERRTDQQRKWLSNEFDSSLRKAKSQLAKTILEVRHVDVSRYETVGSSFFGRSLMEKLNDESAKSAKTLRAAATAYYLRTGGDKWPEDLEDLAHPQDGSKPYVTGGLEATKNVWGKPFRLRIDETKNGPLAVILSEVTSPEGWTEVEFK